MLTDLDHVEEKTLDSVTQPARTLSLPLPSPEEINRLDRYLQLQRSTAAIASHATKPRKLPPALSLHFVIIEIALHSVQRMRCVYSNQPLGGFADHLLQSLIAVHQPVFESMRHPLGME